MSLLKYSQTAVRREMLLQMVPSQARPVDNVMNDLKVSLSDVENGGAGVFLHAPL
jgi:hypothetical protein